MTEEKLCPCCGEPACFCPEGVKQPSVQWSGMFDDEWDEMVARVRPDAAFGHRDLDDEARAA